jgi:hypothetical protein
MEMNTARHRPLIVRGVTWIYPFASRYAIKKFISLALIKHYFNESGWNF